MVSNIMSTVFQTSSPWMAFLLVINLILCLYPILGALFWFFGALSYMAFRHDEELAPTDNQLTTEPLVTIMIPAHNEEVVIQGTLEYLLNELTYHNYEILVMDDGSNDATPQIIHELQEKYPCLRTIRIEENQGKAHAFNIGIFFAKGDYILSNDADTIPERDALTKYMRYFTSPEGTTTPPSRLIWTSITGPPSGESRRPSNFRVSWGSSSAVRRPSTIPCMPIVGPTRCIAVTF